MIFFIFMLLLSLYFKTLTFVIIGLLWIGLGYLDKPHTIKEIKIEGGKEL